jgi:hypothetical protein
MKSLGWKGCGARDIRCLLLYVFSSDPNSLYHSSQGICHYNWANQIMDRDFASPVHFSPLPPVATYILDLPLSVFLIYCWC